MPVENGEISGKDMLLRIGSRGSQLALWQANHIASLLRARGHRVEIEIIKTTGDKIIDVSLDKVGAKGMFTKEIEEALEAGRIDLAVHSLKDLPTELPPDLELAAVTKRERANDVFVSRKFASLAELPQAARIGTSSLRRQAQLKALRADLEVLALRGNVDTRLGKLEAGDYDGIILAAAGLYRLGRMQLAREVIPPEMICPAAGQGALGVEIRRCDVATSEAVRFLDDAAARVATTCERALLARLGGGCQVPVGAYAEAIPGRLELQAIVARPDGTRVLRARQIGKDPLEVGNLVGEELLGKGAREILEEAYGMATAAPEQP